MKLQIKLEDLYTGVYRLIAIYSPYPIYRLAFVLNQNLNTRLHYSEPLITHENPGGFNVYECESPQGTHWALIQNTGYIEEKISDFDLFSLNDMGISKMVFYLNSYKHIPYFLRIREDEDSPLDYNPVKILSGIPGIDSLEELDWENFEYQKALLF
jgi:hypothetical protein